MVSPAEPRQRWDAAASAWDSAHDWYSRHAHPVTDWFCGAVGRPGGRVLDLACGSGQPALALARSVGSRGRVVATDIAPGMVGVVARRARAAALDNLEALEMDAAELRFAEGTFDAVTCSFGLMLCPDPVAVAVQACRVLGPGGRLAVAVWDSLEHNPFFGTVAAPFAAVYDVPPPDPSAPGPFRLGSIDALERVLRAGGLVDVAVERVHLTFELESAEAYWRLHTRLAGALVTRRADATSADEAHAITTLRAACEPFEVGGRLRLAATALCALGRAAV